VQHLNGQYIFSASDLVDYLECPHLTTLNLRDLDEPLPRTEPDDEIVLRQEKGAQHERAHLARLEQEGKRVRRIPDDAGLEARVRLTREAMAEGADVIYQATFVGDGFLGHVDFLRRVERLSAVGQHDYEVVDTKLARSPKARFVVQLWLYSELLGRAQGVEPRSMHVVLGDDAERSFRVANFARYCRNVQKRFLEHVRTRPETYPKRCAHCPLCHWRELCEAQWEADDHLNRVAGITERQIEKLQGAGVQTLAALAGHEGTVPGIGTEILERLRRQAALQLERHEMGKSRAELVKIPKGDTRGFARLPNPNAGDLFFDLEGDPYEPDGLEYLIGVHWLERGKPKYRAFWAHDRDAESASFEGFMDFVTEWLERHSKAHLYHYGHYEPTALKRLMSLHGTREAAVDDLLREERLVNLYNVVREAIRISESGYSLKDLEVFYMLGRESAVTTAMASVVWYERWREIGDESLLEDIRRYNEDDCRSLRLLRDWLLELRPAGTTWFAGSAPVEEPRKSERIAEIEARIADYETRLIGGQPDDRAQWSEQDQVRELVFQLLDFHRRAAKPEWWAIFDRMEKTHEELVDDPECIGDMRLDTDVPPTPDKRSVVYTYDFPAQEYKLGEGKDCYRTDTAAPQGTIVALDENAGRLHLKVGPSRPMPPERLSLGPGGPINIDPLREAIFRFADSLLTGDGRYRALEDLLARRPPRIARLKPGKPVIDLEGELIDQTVDAVSRLKTSYLFIQGPPGAGKTFTGSHVILELLRQGRTVGVSSNSHKAINNLLKEVEERAAEKGYSIVGAKKSNSRDPETCFGGSMIEDVFSNDAISPGHHRLVAGTAWLFADLDQTLDYLVVDEAGQVSLANLVAMGTSARNLVLIGDQMQLGQPIQGVHPGRSGESSLEYLLDGAATIAPERGIFLHTTWRMHPDVCRFISDAVYDGRLRPEPDNATQRLILKRDFHPALRATGVRFVEIQHEARSQHCPEEAELVRAIYESLLQQLYQDRKGKRHRMTPDGILVVAPYNVQVNLLRSTLPEGARIGTVDKFQGQQAEVVICSMTTSSGEYLPRHIGFLYDKNRLNVALSRARCLSLLVASPALMAIRCSTVEQMELVNTLCWVHEYSDAEGN
jgi:uncharacterized protein